MIRWARNLIQPLFLLVALVFAALLLRNQWHMLQDYNWHFQSSWMILGACLLLGGFFLEATVWWLGLRVLSHHTSNLVTPAPEARSRWPQGVGARWSQGWRNAMRIWFLCAVARYVPGNIWQPLSMAYLNRQQGVRPEATLTSIVLYQILNLLAVLPFAAFYLYRLDNVGLLSRLDGSLTMWIALFSMVPLLALLVRPQWLLQMVNTLLHRLGRRSLPLQLKSRQLLQLLLIAAFDWILWGAGFACIVFGLGQFSTTEQVGYLPYLIVSFPIAYAAGYLSFITPSGLVVREGVLFLLLTPILGGVTVAVASIVTRVIQILLEVGAAGGLTLYTRTNTAPAWDADVRDRS